jgi:hypothetical protein
MGCSMCIYEAEFNAHM